MIAPTAIDSSSDVESVQRLLKRYRDLLATAGDDLLRRGIAKQIESLEAKLQDLEPGRD